MLVTLTTRSSRIARLGELYSRLGLSPKTAAIAVHSELIKPSLAGLTPLTRPRLSEGLHYCRRV